MNLAIKRAPLTLNRRNELSTILSSDVVEDIEIGHGSFGTVFKGTFKNYIPVAIKKLRPNHISTKYIDIFLDEARILSSLHHSCIVGFIGLVKDNDELGYSIITEVTHNIFIHFSCT